MLFVYMGGTLILEMVKSRFTGVFYRGKTLVENFLLKNFQIFLRHRGPISEGDEADFPKIGYFQIFQIFQNKVFFSDFEN